MGQYDDQFILDSYRYTVEDVMRQVRYGHTGSYAEVLAGLPAIAFRLLDRQHVSPAVQDSVHSLCHSLHQDLLIPLDKEEDVSTGLYNGFAGVFLAVQGISRDDVAFNVKFTDEFTHCRDFIRLLCNYLLTQGYASLHCICTHHTHGRTLAGSSTADFLAIDGYHLPVRFFTF